MTTNPHLEALGALYQLRRALAAITYPDPRGCTFTAFDVHRRSLAAVEATVRQHDLRQTFEDYAKEGGAG